MKKRIILILLVLCLSVLSGCNPDRRNQRLFRNGFEQLQELTAMHVRNEQYMGTGKNEQKLLTIRNEWRNGEDFYWEGDDGSQFLGRGDSYWSIDPPRNTSWKKAASAYSFSDFWQNYDAEEFLTGEVTFRSEGEYVVMEQIKNHGNNNCVRDTYVSTNTFYIDEDGSIVRITLTVTAYDGSTVNPDRLRSADTDEYYITPIEEFEAEKIILEKHNTIAE